jgi:multiple sugar transport system substrate-binding protein
MFNRSANVKVRSRRGLYRSARGRLAMVGGAVLCIAAVAGVEAAGASAKHSLVTLTEIDYYNSGASQTALPPILKACGAENGAKIDRQVVNQASLVPELIKDVSARAVPNLMLIDNPNIQQFAATGALVPLKINTKGSFPSVVAAGSYQGKSYGFAPGVNDLALYYNKAMFAAAGITSPPTDWAELQSDAKTLTHGNVYGLAFSAPNEEEASFQFEPFFWSNGGELNKLDSPDGVAALTYWDTLVNDGYVSKSVVTWTQADVEEQFAAGDAAMMVNGPWQLPVLATSPPSGGFDTAPIPAPTAGGKVVSPLGGEMWTVGRSSSAKEKAAEGVVKCLVSKKESVVWSKVDGYLSSNEAGAKAQAAANPLLQAFADEISTARARTGPPADLGPNYNTVSQLLWTAIQSALDGSQTPTAALQTAQSSLPSGV